MLRSAELQIFFLAKNGEGKENKIPVLHSALDVTYIYYGEMKYILLISRTLLPNYALGIIQFAAYPNLF